MKVCKQCGKAVSYNSYFKAYFCNECGWYCAEEPEIKRRTATLKNNITLKENKSKKVMAS